MIQLILDIETAGEDFQNLPERVQKGILRDSETEEEKEERKNMTALWPITGEVVTIALLNADTEKGKVFFQYTDKQKEDYKKNGFEFIGGSEAELLEEFWKTLGDFDRKDDIQVVTWFGRGFDAPYLYFRSAVNGVKPSFDLMGNRYQDYNHLDLKDRMHYYGAVPEHFGLEYYAEALDIENPKLGEVEGEQVTEEFKKGNIREINDYCIRDVKTTKKIYEKWNQYMNSANF